MRSALRAVLEARWGMRWQGQLLLARAVARVCSRPRTGQDDRRQCLIKCGMLVTREMGVTGVGGVAQITQCPPRAARAREQHQMHTGVSQVTRRTSQIVTLVGAGPSVANAAWLALRRQFASTTRTGKLCIISGTTIGRSLSTIVLQGAGNKRSMRFDGRSVGRSVDREHAVSWRLSQGRAGAHWGSGLYKNGGGVWCGDEGERGWEGSGRLGWCE